jgi:hypothetical protein
VHASRADLSPAFCSYCGYPPLGRWRSLAHRVCMRCEMGTVLRAPPGALSSLDASIGAALRHAEVLADDRLTAETRFDPQSGPAAAAWAKRATSRLGRAAASRGLPTPGSVAPGGKRMSLDGVGD